MRTPGKITRFENLFHDLRLHRLKLVAVDSEAFHVRQQGTKGDIFGNEHASSRTFKLEITGSFGEFGVGTAGEVNNCLGASTDGVLFLHNKVVDQRSLN